MEAGRDGAAGVPVPEGFILSTEATSRFYRQNAGLIRSFLSGQMGFPELVDVSRFPRDVEDALKDSLDRLQAETGRTMGDRERPLLVSVRAGGDVSMPGMLFTVCNIGVTDEMLAEAPPFWLLDAYRRFIESYGVLVAGVDPERFEEARRGAGEGTFSGLKALVEAFRSLYPVPQDPFSAVRRVIRALLLSANNERTAEYRRINYLSGELRVGITVQRMVFGNLNERSGAGVVFTRDPSSGEPRTDGEGRRRLLGQYRRGGQGTDVVDDRGEVEPLESMAEDFPEIVEALERIFLDLEVKEGFVQDGEFTVEDGTLWVLQTRPSKMSPAGTLQAVVDLVSEGRLDEAGAIRRVGARQLEKLLYAKEQLVDLSNLERIGSGRTLVPGVAAGHLVFTAQAAQRYKGKNETVILCRNHLRNEDIHLFDQVDGILAAQKNQSSHATLVARASGLPALIEADVEIDTASRTLGYVSRNLDPVTLEEGTYLTLDAGSGSLYRGFAPLRGSDLSDPVLNRFFGFLNDRPTLKVFTQTEDRASFEVARRLGAEGLFNFRSDVIFFHREVNFALCSMLMAPPGEAEEKAGRLTDLLAPAYEDLFRYAGREVGIRLVKHTMREYFPTASYEVRMLAEFLVGEAGGDPLDEKAVNRTVRAIREKRKSLADYNPIMGLRGVRLAAAFPSVYESQLRALFRAALAVEAEGIAVNMDLLIPYLTLVDEFTAMRDWIARIAREEAGRGSVRWRAVPVIEVSGIALEADELARHADRIVIRSDKLTTSTHHLVREDAHAFLGGYVDRGWFFGDPFRIIQTSTERLVRTAIEAARRTNPGVSVMVAGDHCANEYSLRRLLHLGISEVCAPPRMVPLVKLIALNLEMAGVRPALPS